jgi:hypothetical protein
MASLHGSGAAGSPPYCPERAEREFGAELDLPR